MGPSGQIRPSTCWTRWARAPPSDVSHLTEPLVVQDPGEDSPTFARLLYRDMDWTMLDLYIMLFVAFDDWLGNSLLALFIVYCIECVYRLIRQRVSVSNLSKKAYVDDR